MDELKDRCPELMGLLRYTEDSVVYMDLQLRFVMVSEAKARRAGLATYKEMLGKTDFDFMPYEEALRSTNDNNHVIQTGKSIIDLEEELTGRDGTKYWVSVSKFPWRDKNEKIIGVIAIARNISERKEMQNHILRMLTIASHDMLKPIVGIGLIIKRLFRGRYGPVGESVCATLQDVSQRLASLEGIVGNYLTTSSLIGASVGEKEDLDLRQDIVDPILEELSQIIERKRIVIDNILGSIPGNRIKVKANKNWLSIVYRNLLSNAIRYTYDGGTISFGFEEKDGYYRLNVYNDGPPVDPSKTEEIFKMFVSDNSTGLGLSISRELMRKHGGDLWYENSLDGHPNFVFTLPKE